jgi:RNA polymerase sigma factor (TIGR02999 family)
MAEAGAEPEVSALLAAWGAGDARALDALVPRVYGNLRRLARRQLRREAPGHTLQSSDLVHEAFLRLQAQDRVQWRSRGHFLAVAARAMRRLLVDHARRKAAQRRGGGARRLDLDDVVVALDPRVDLLDLDRALERLEALDPRQASLVELRYFAGLTVAETAELLGVSTATVDRDWAMARAWLRRELDQSPRSGERQRE